MATGEMIPLAIRTTIAAYPATKVAMFLESTEAAAGTLALPVGALIAAFAAIFQAGILTGLFNEHRTSSNQRLERLELSNDGRITRDEIDTRFDALQTELSRLHSMLEQALKTFNRTHT